MSRELYADVIIVGSGAGGGTMAYALKDSGLNVLILERGDFLPQEGQNWSPEDTVARGRYKPDEYWHCGKKRFRGSNHYYVGGMTKMFGACLARMREPDFEEYGLDDGLSPGWPVTYQDLEPYYGLAEEIWGVRGSPGQDPMEPRRSTPYPHAGLAHEPEVERLAGQLRAQGLHPYTLPMGVDFGDGGACVRSRYCDGFSCALQAKCDAEMRCVRPALRSPNVELQTNCKVERLLTDVTGRNVEGAEVFVEGERKIARAKTFVISAGAVNTAALFLRSANASHPNGLANSSDQVGRNYMQNRDSALSGIDPRRINDSAFQKTLGISDFHLSPDGNHPRLGTLQTTGKVLHEHITGAMPWVPKGIASFAAKRSIDWWLMTEDCPLPQNRVELAPRAGIRIHWQQTSVKRHRRLIFTTGQMMRRAGYPLVVWKHFGIDTNAHQSGTMRLGESPESSVLDTLCRPHDLDNVHVVDSSFQPSVGAGPGGPTLTVAAMALRIAELSPLLRGGKAPNLRQEKS